MRLPLQCISIVARGKGLWIRGASCYSMMAAAPHHNQRRIRIATNHSRLKESGQAQRGAYRLRAHVPGGTIRGQRHIGAVGRCRPAHVPRRDDDWRAPARGKRPTTRSPNSDFWVGIEGGIEDTALGMTCFAWVVLIGADDGRGRGQTGVFYLPQEVAELVRGGMELGHADDAVFQRDNSKQANGAIGLLTDDIIDREAYYVHALIMALVPFKNPELNW